MRARLRDVAAAAAKDPKKALLDELGDISGIELLHNLVLVATYIEPDKTKGGVWLPDNSLLENRFQGKGALVLKKGPLAFVDDNVAKFGGVSIEEGDWVVVRPSDGFEMFVGEAGSRHGIACRVFEDTQIKARLADPSCIY